VKELIEVMKLIADPVYIILLAVIWLLYKIITDSIAKMFDGINKQAGTLEKLATLIEVMVHQGRTK